MEVLCEKIGVEPEVPVERNMNCTVENSLVHHEEAERLLHNIHLLDTIAVKKQNIELKEYDLTVQQFIAIRQIYLREKSGQPATQRTIESFLCATNPTVSGMLQGMEKKGLILRTSNPQNQKENLLFVSDKALSMLEGGTEVLHKMESTATRGMRVDEIEVFQDLLTRALNNLKE